MTYWIVGVICYFVIAMLAEAFVHHMLLSVYLSRGPVINSLVAVFAGIFWLILAVIVTCIWSWYLIRAAFKRKI